MVFFGFFVPRGAFLDFWLWVVYTESMSEIIVPDGLVEPCEWCGVRADPENGVDHTDQCPTNPAWLIHSMRKPSPDKEQLRSWLDKPERYEFFTRVWDNGKLRIGGLVVYDKREGRVIHASCNEDNEQLWQDVSRK